MTSEQTHPMEQVLHNVPELVQKALKAMAAENDNEATRLWTRLKQLNSYLDRKGLDEIEVSEKTEILLEIAMELGPLHQCLRFARRG